MFHAICSHSTRYAPSKNTAILANLANRLSAFPTGEPVTSQGRWGPLAVDEVLSMTNVTLTPALSTCLFEAGIFDRPSLPSASLHGSSTKGGLRSVGLAVQSLYIGRCGVGLGLAPAVEFGKELGFTL